MDQAGEALPIRLRPRKWSQIFYLAFFGVFFAFALFWMVMASRTGARLEFNEVEVTDPQERALFPLFGIPFALVGACGLAIAGLKVIPNSPCYYLDLSADGLTLRTLFKQRSFAWHELPPFESLRMASSSENSAMITYYYYAVAMDRARDGRRPRELLRISASEYGTKNSEQSAVDLAARLNLWREMALQGRLPPQAPASHTPAAVVDVKADRTVTRMR